MSTTSTAPSSIGIIGGNGQFGRWCTALLEREGVRVFVSDVGTELTNSALAERVDAIVVSVPIGVTQRVLDEIRPYVNERQIVVDLTSVKTPFMPTLEALPCEVLSLHPMFAPSTQPAGQTCAVMRVRAGAYADFFENILAREGIRLVFMDADEHDRTMAVVQGLTHFQAIAAAHAMATLEFIPEDTLESASPVYRLRLAMVGRILAQNPRLYAEIQVYNPYVREVLVALEESSRLLQGFVERRDVDGFVAEFERARDALGTFRERALEESNALIQALAKRSGG